MNLARFNPQYEYSRRTHLLTYHSLTYLLLTRYLANRASRAAQAPRPMLPLAPGSDPRDAESPTDAESGLASPADGVPDDGKPLLRG